MNTRARQAVDKRIDLLHHYVGLKRQARLLEEAAESTRRFFFSPDELLERAQLLRNHLPYDAEEIVREADEICRHRFTLLGFNDLDFGTDIDWHYDPVHGVRAPLRAAHKISFLDHDLVGDHKVVWELNRHQHLVTLAKTWVLTQEEKYATELIHQWYSWQRANPYPIGINWASALEVAFRSLSWLWVRFLLSGSRVLPATFEHDLMCALALNGSHIERYLSTYFSPNTHLLGELTALFFIGTLCPQISKAESWQHAGWNGLLKEIDRQVRSDGVYFEQSLYYHVYALDFFLHSRALAICNRISVPTSFDAVLGKMLDFLRILSQAGPPQLFGDDDGGRVFNHARNGCEHLTDPLVLGAIQFGRKDAIVSITEEALWLFGRRALEVMEGCGAPPEVRSASFEDSGTYVMASSESHALQMVIDAGSMGAGRAGHGHADALSATVSFDRRRWLIDPGTFVYVPEISRNSFRVTSAHNTWTVDGQNQVDPSGPFAWDAIPDVRREHWITGETFALLTASHNGYSRLSNPVTHRRSVFYLNDRFWLVRDFFEGRGVHDCVGAWHFAHDLEIRPLPDAFIAYSATSSHVQSSRLALLPVQTAGWKCEITAGQMSRAYGISEKSPVLRIKATAQLPTEFAVVIVPLRAPESEPGNLTFALESTGWECNNANGYVYAQRGESHFVFFSGGNGDWQLGPWASDADLLYCCMQDNGPKHMIICGGSFARFAGKVMFTHSKTVERFEWLAHEDSVQVFSSEDNIASSVFRGYDAALH